MKKNPEAREKKPEEKKILENQKILNEFIAYFALNQLIDPRFMMNMCSIFKDKIIFSMLSQLEGMSFLILLSLWANEVLNNQ